jgi:hypothetical protein
MTRCRRSRTLNKRHRSKSSWLRRSRSRTSVGCGRSWIRTTDLRLIRANAGWDETCGRKRLRADRSALPRRLRPCPALAQRERRGGAGRAGHLSRSVSPAPPRKKRKLTAAPSQKLRRDSRRNSLPTSPRTAANSSRFSSSSRSACAASAFSFSANSCRVRDLRLDLVNHAVCIVQAADQGGDTILPALRNPLLGAAEVVAERTREKRCDRPCKRSRHADERFHRELTLGKRPGQERLGARAARGLM